MAMTSFETLSRIALREHARTLCERHQDAPPEAVLEAAIRHEFAGRIGLVSSFGTEAAVLLHMLSRIDPAVPVIFLDTLHHFPETLAYRDTLCERLGLQDLRIVTPHADALQADDPTGELHRRNPDLCCHVRKTLPMLSALQGIDCWITGRKRSQSATRADLELFEVQDRWIKLNPLLHWGGTEVDAYFASFDLPGHPLRARGYASVGCAPCTRSLRPGEDARAGRWAGQAKTECGIHIEGGRVVAASAGPKPASPPRTAQPDTSSETP
ncbi:MAG: phosphoadenylyl-sulfate reductase [Pararhodobacter sp.]